MTERDSNIKRNIKIHYCTEKLLKRFFLESRLFADFLFSLWFWYLILTKSERQLYLRGALECKEPCLSYVSYVNFMICRTLFFFFFLVGGCCSSFDMCSFCVFFFISLSSFICCICILLTVIRLVMF
jgi:hypothetical protein